MWPGPRRCPRPRSMSGAGNASLGPARPRPARAALPRPASPVPRPPSRWWHPVAGATSLSRVLRAQSAEGTAEVTETLRATCWSHRAATWGPSPPGLPSVHAPPELSALVLLKAGAVALQRRRTVSQQRSREPVSRHLPFCPRRTDGRADGGLGTSVGAGEPALPPRSTPRPTPRPAPCPAPRCLPARFLQRRNFCWAASAPGAPH